MRTRQRVFLIIVFLFFLAVILTISGLSTAKITNYAEAASNFDYKLNVFEIDTQSKYNDFAVNLAPYHDFSGKTVRLAGNFDCGGNTLFGELFNGILYGDTSILTNISAPFFGSEIGENAIISDIAFTDCPVSGNLLAGINNGQIKKIFVKGNLNSDNYLVGTNNGDIVKTVSHCGRIAASNNGIVDLSVAFEESVPVAINQNSVIDTDYYGLINAGFDFKNDFSYLKNDKIMNCPSLRLGGEDYKEWNNLYSDKTITYTYDAAKSYSTESLILKIVDTMAVFQTIEWEYNGIDYTLDYIKNAGEYKIFFDYAGTDYYLPSKYIQTITIKKAIYPEALMFEDGAFADINVTYDGNNVNVTKPLPDNASDFSFVWETVQNGEPAVPCDSGIYYQRITGRSDNYFDITAQRKITINRRLLEASVGNFEVAYGLDADLSGVDIVINSGLADMDKGKALSEIAESYEIFSDYSAGDDVGIYSIKVSAQIKNYELRTVIAGALTVNKTDFPQADIIFNGKNVIYNGNKYSLTVINVPEKTDVQYLNNEQTYAGEYNVTAVLTNKNYNELRLDAVLIIAKKEVVFIPENMVLNYDAGRLEIAQDTFSYRHEGFVPGDENLIQTLDFMYSVRKDGIVITEFNAGEYDIEINVMGDLTNYSLSEETGNLSILPVSLKALYPSQGDKSTEYDGEEQYYKITFFDEYNPQINYTYSLNNMTVDLMRDVGNYKITAEVKRLNDNYLDTIYVYYLHITKININIYFEKSEYELIYDGEEHINTQSFPYSGNLPSGLDITFSVLKNGIAATNTKNVGSYQIEYFVPESGNYFEKIIIAAVTVKPRSVDITVKNNYTYTGHTIVPEIMHIENNINDELTANNFIFTYYKDSNEIPLISVTGNYTAEARLKNNENFKYMPIRFVITVEKRNVIVDLNQLKFTYGTNGEYSYGGINYRILSGGIIIRKDYYIKEIDDYVDLQYSTGEDTAGTYIINSVLPTVNYNFTISEKSIFNLGNRVEIERAVLTASWRYDNGIIVGYKSFITYSGKDQAYKFSYELLGFVDGVRQVDCEIQLEENKGKEIKNVGEYDLKLILINQSNYRLDGKMLHIIMAKAVLDISCPDMTVLQGEPFYGGNCTASNLKGEDSGKSLILLDGFKSELKTNYYTILPAQTKNIYYYYELTFDNYIPNIVKKGNINILFNNKINFTFQDETYIYDGNYHELVVGESQQIIDAADVVITYSDNYRQSSVGTYNVTATIHYNVDNDEKKYTRTLTILPATPVITAENKKIPYIDNYILPDSLITGTAFLNGQTVSGSFVFTEKYTLSLGKAIYLIAFVPTDNKNILSVNDEIEIESVALGIQSFVFSDYGAVDFGDNNVITISTAVVMHLRSGILDGLSIWKDNIKYNEILLNKTETITIGIKSDGQTVYEQDFDIILNESEQSDDNFKINEDVFVLTEGMGFLNGILYATDGGGRISLNDEAKNIYVLYINGVEVKENAIINGNEGKIVIVVKDRVSHATVFSKEYTVREENLPKIDKEEKDYVKIWIIVGSSIGGILVISFVAAVAVKIIQKKKIGKS